jgi:predicted RNase H-like HicB family nuclease
VKKKVKIKNHFAVFESAEEGGFNVSFPNLSGCVTFGKDFQHAKKMAKEVLELWLAKYFAFDVVQDFQAAGLYCEHFLKDLEVGLSKSNYQKRKP